MRTFMAVETTQEVSNRISYVQEKLKKSGFYGSWPVTRNVHLTLFFFGEIEEAKTKGIIEVMDEVATKTGKFELITHGTSFFPSKGLPRVIWLGCEGEGVRNLYKSLKGPLKKIGFNFGNEFTPHITVGRIKGVPKNWRKKISEVEYDPVKFTCSYVNLLSSKLTPHGSIYTTIHKSKLGGLKL